MSARPARLGLLTPAAVDGVSWLATFEAALAAQTRFWGGSGNLIFPLNVDFTEQEVFWALAEVFDPDAFVVYAPTLAEMERLEPKFYAETIASYEEKVGGKEGSERFIADTRDDVVLYLQPRPEQAVFAVSSAAGIGWNLWGMLPHLLPQATDRYTQVY